ncbi:MAG TPA: acyltransferase, partial [Acidimicrobiia bacterium]
MSPRELDGAQAETEPLPSRRQSRARRVGRGEVGSFGYQPALDGIRAFAVAAVLLYHGGQSWAVGGYLGVDAFFVLSGFLITTLLVTEWSGRQLRGRGRIDLRAFWIRRARRLLPALFFVMIGVVVYAAVFAAPGEVDRIRQDSLATLGYVANWRFIFSGQSYFDQFTQPSPLRHMWSLAIEEQFYLSWPLIVGFVLWWRRSVRALLVIAVTMVVASATLMALLFHHGHDPSRVYYGTDTRAQSLLMGAVLGIVLFLHGPIRSLVARIALRAFAIVGAGYTLWLWWRMSERTDALYQGGFVLAALAVAAVIASVVQPDRGALGAALSWGPLRWVGRISY